ncbi:hypothetical protein H5410_016378 [Solanum commersonii]|uniref:Uncharacterized protein n=1 Tax=Solanum commersonii TaxID=4109 RepID=A0A9J5ZX82_SOLCO|nr:hypothetical protein H5410_016378 [Solanum commersonii]
MSDICMKIWHFMEKDLGILIPQEPTWPPISTGDIGIPSTKISHKFTSYKVQAYFNNINISIKSKASKIMLCVGSDPNQINDQSEVVKC